MNLQAMLTAPIFRGSLIALLSLAGIGCTPSFELKPQAEVPVPLARPLPLNVAAYYPDEFRHYVYEENTEERPNWRIECGPSQVVLFEQVLPSLFSRFNHVDGISNADDPDLDAILVPQVDEMQFSLPAETMTDLYEVWLRYMITLYEPGGQEIARFPVQGYGKSTTSLFKGADDGLDSAINAAFRDVGARLTLGFRKNEALAEWLAAKQAEWEQRGGLTKR